jgi:hypothetical protein
MFENGVSSSTKRRVDLSECATNLLHGNSVRVCLSMCVRVRVREREREREKAWISEMQLFCSFSFLPRTY